MYLLEPVEGRVHRTAAVRACHRARPDPADGHIYRVAEPIALEGQLVTPLAAQGLVVVAVPAHDVVVAPPAIDDVAAPVTAQRVIVAAADQRVVEPRAAHPLYARDHVDVAKAVERRVRRNRHSHLSGGRSDDIVFRQVDDHAHRAGRVELALVLVADEVAAVAAIHGVVTGAAGEGVVTFPARQAVVAGVPPDNVIAITAIDCVSSAPGANRVVAVIAVDGIVVERTSQRLAVVGPQDDRRLGLQPIGERRIDILERGFRAVDHIDGVVVVCVVRFVALAVAAESHDGFIVDDQRTTAEDAGLEAAIEVVGEPRAEEDDLHLAPKPVIRQHQCEAGGRSVGHRAAAQGHHHQLLPVVGGQTMRVRERRH